jgi:hypothetical protein
MKLCARILVPISLLIPLVLIAQAPQRSRGISIHMLPKRAAELGHDKWGFTVDYPPLSEGGIRTAGAAISRRLSFVRAQTG